MRSRKGAKGPTTVGKSERNLTSPTIAIEIDDGLDDLGVGLVEFENYWPADQEQWGVATFGFCMDCGARIDPSRLRPMRVALLCLDCLDARQCRSLWSAVHDS